MTTITPLPLGLNLYYRRAFAPLSTPFGRPVADGDRHANLLVEYGIGDMDGPNNYRHNDSDNDRGDVGEAAAAAPRFR